MRQRLSFIKAIILSLCLVFAASSYGMAQQKTSEHGFALGVLKLQTQSNDKLSLVVELATTTAERGKGLMHRSALTDSDGMLFLWPDKAVRQFWMKNTPLSLDILFFDSDGILVHEALRQTPFSTDLISSLLPVQYVLELPAGRATSLGIEIGTQITKVPHR